MTELLVEYAFFITSAILIAGFIASIMLNKFGIPDSMFLIGLGILIGPVLRLLPPSEFLGLAPYIGALAFVAIMFESSLGINVHELIETARHATILAILTFFSSLIASTLFVHLLLNRSLMEGILFGSIIGGSSSAVIAAIAPKVGLNSFVQLIVSLESILSDVFCVVSTIVVLTIMTSPPSMTPGQIGGYVASKFCVSIVLGFVFGLILLNILYRVKRYKHVYTATLAALIFLYALAEFLRGSGAVSVLIAGIILSNFEHLPFSLTTKRETGTLKFQRVFLESFHSELTLLIKVFFYVEVGLVFTVHNPLNLIVALILSVLLLAVRYPNALLVSTMAKLRNATPTITVFYARGLSAAVLAFLPALHGIPNARFYTESASGIVVITNVILTLSYWFIKRRSQYRPSYYFPWRE
ncbi:MAG: cation:proton antiporter [Candidatus Geothermarchaeales archaeon]